MYTILKSLLFLLDPEKAHNLTFFLLKLSKYFPGFLKFMGENKANSHPSLSKNLFGLNFKNSVGLAAGLDKNGIAFNELGNLGFGFIEIGTVTPKPQPGNEKPRLFRLPKNEALINRMGFNNDGVVEAAKRLKKRKNNSLIIGGNIGKNKLTSNENAVYDYEICFNELYEVVDYFVVNVSSPNTPNLRDLQEKIPLTNLLNSLQAINNSKLKPKPILLKIAPDLTNTQLDDIIEIVKHTKLSGVIATNTTISRDGLDYDKQEIDKMWTGYFDL
jgi:dihydroorotate dehydrogenase